MGTRTDQSPFQAKIERTVPAVAAGVDDTTTLFRMPFTGTITSVSFVPDADIAGANTNTRKVSVVNKGAAGNGTTEMAALQFNSGVNGSDYDEKAITPSATAADLDAVEGDIIAWVSLHVGTGIADPGGLVIVTITRD